MFVSWDNIQPLVPLREDRYYYWNGTIISNIDKFNKSIPIDEELIYFKAKFVQDAGRNIANLAGIDKWVLIASTTHMSLEEYLNLDEFWQEAVYYSVSRMVDSQNKEQQKTMHEMSQRIEDLRPHSSPIMNKPTFHLP